MRITNPAGNPTAGEGTGQLVGREILGEPVAGDGRVAGPDLLRFLLEVEIDGVAAAAQRFGNCARRNMHPEVSRSREDALEHASLRSGTHWGKPVGPPGFELGTNWL